MKIRLYSATSPAFFIVIIPICSSACLLIGHTNSHLLVAVSKSVALRQFAGMPNYPSMRREEASVSLFVGIF
jgi:hypothetical protein